MLLQFSFELKSSSEGELKYTAALESGNTTVYYECNGHKEELFSIGGGDEIDSHGGYIEKGTVYVIIETDSECMNGNFSFSLE